MSKYRIRVSRSFRDLRLDLNGELRAMGLFKKRFGSKVLAERAIEQISNHSRATISEPKHFVVCEVTTHHW